MSSTHTIPRCRCSTYQQTKTLLVGPIAHRRLLLVSDLAGPALPCLACRLSINGMRQVNMLLNRGDAAPWASPAASGPSPAPDARCSEAVSVRHEYACRSSFLGSGRWTGAWTGDNAATWADLKCSVWSILGFGLHGIPMIGEPLLLHSSSEQAESCRTDACAERCFDQVS